MDIQNMIYVIRNKSVMLDSDLAQLYGVETRALNQAVKRNLKRFPSDFMFQLTKGETEALKSQFVTSNSGRGGTRKEPFVFTENGVAMLSGVLRSDQAVEVNISIMRTFTKLRSYFALEGRLEHKISNLDRNVTRVFKIVFEKLDRLEERRQTPLKRRKIGLKK